MKKIVTLALTLTCGAVLAQKNDNVGIGTTKPDPSAILDLSSTSKGFLLPRMTQTQREAIQTPATGLMVFQTDQTVGTYVFDGTTWQPTARVGTTATVGAWDLQGNIIDATDYIGSDNDFPLVFKVNNIRAGFLDNSGNANVFFGVNSGIGNTSYWNTGLGVGTLSAALTGNSNTAVGRFSMNKNTTGTANTSIGVQSLENNTQGDYNMAVGVFALRSNTLGDNNAAIGSQALQFNQTGNSNLALGTNALFNNISGSENIAIGQGALFGAMSGSISQNTAIGTSAGQNATGSGNVFLGYSAGANETGSNMLYISNSVTNSPLLKGSFSATAPWLRINVKSAPMSPTPTTTGYMAIGDFDTAPAGAGAGGLGLPSTFSSGAYRLYVQDGILTEKLKVALRNSSEWADYVFSSDYKLMPLDKVELFIKNNKHLPNVPSAVEVASEGIDISKTSIKLLEKIEELTLYVIQLKKEINELQNRNK